MRLFKADKRMTPSKLQQQDVILIAMNSGLLWQLLVQESVNPLFPLYD